jgi:perosamine synthetase
VSDDNVIQFPGRDPDEPGGERASEPRPGGEARGSVLMALDDAADVLKSGWLTQGRQAQLLRDRAAAFFGSSQIVPVAGGAAAMHLALLSLELQRGDEVIIPSLTHAGLPTLVALAGGRPVLADIIAPELPVLDPADVRARLSENTRAIVATHVHGHPAPLVELLALAEQQGLALIEDCARALGARLSGRPVGTFGRFGAFSLQPQPDGGGLIICADVEQRRKLEGLRSSAAPAGDDALEHSVDIALANGYRIDEAAASEGVRRLETLDDELAERRDLLRRAAAVALGRGLGVAFANETIVGAETAAEQLALLTIGPAEARALHARLRELGLEAMRPLCLHHTPPYSHQLPRLEMPRTDAYCARAVELRVTPDLSLLANL